jgi:hypothetical protein
MPADDQVPLGAVDMFHLRCHQELLQQGLSGNGCALCVEVEGRLDVARLEARLARAVALVPELRFTLARSLRSAFVWRPSARHAPRVEVSSLTGDLVEALARAVARPIDGTQPWRLGVLRGPENDALVLEWFHPLTDARGAARLVAWLGADDESPPEVRRVVSDRLIARLDRRERRSLAQTYLSHALALARVPTASLWGAARGRGVGAPGMVRLRLSAEETRAFDASLKARAGLADTSLVLFAAARLCDRALAARGHSPPVYLVPLPLSLDPKNERQRMFGNHLTMMMMALDRQALDDEARAVASLAEQRRQVVRSKLDVAMIAALDLARHLPARLYNGIACWPFGGERGSLVVSNPGSLAIDDFMGLTVRDAFSAPTVLGRPGLQVIVDRHGGRMGALVVFRHGLIETPEVSTLIEGLRHDLLGRA